AKECFQPQIHSRLNILQDLRIHAFPCGMFGFPASEQLMGYVDDLDPTNNLAERQLRPGVIIRKTNGCNRTRSGAQTHSILASVLVTCRQHSVPILDYMGSLQRFGETPPSLTAPP
ncbi:MAG: transposase, partial [Anaerolineales bacterium]|nr:transposase [Anaerolineales bacterium]